MIQRSFLGGRPLSELDELWLPPQGGQTVDLFATTYTLEEVVVARLALSFFHRGDSPSLTRMADDDIKAQLHDLHGRFLVLYDRVGLKKAGGSRSRLKYFVPFMREKVPSEAAPAFHPKLVWMTYRDVTGALGARIFVSSHNLAVSGKFLEAGFSLEFSKSAGPADAKGRLFVRQVHALARRWSPHAVLDRLFKATSGMFCVNWPKNVRAIELINPKTLRTNPAIHLNRHGARSVLAISPFVSTGALHKLLQGDRNVGLITLADTAERNLADFVARARSGDVSPKLDRLRYDTHLGKSGLKPHAKVILSNGKNSGHALIGSSNLTAGGWGLNEELNVHLEFNRRIPGLERKINSLKRAKEIDEGPFDERPEDLVNDKLKTWMSTWKIRWVRSPRHHSSLPLAIEVPPLPAFPRNGAENLWREKTRRQRIVVRCGKLVSKQEAIPPAGRLKLALPHPYEIREIDPIVELQFNDTILVVNPDYDSFPYREDWEKYEVAAFLRALIRPGETGDSGDIHGSQGFSNPSDRRLTTPDLESLVIQLISSESAADGSAAACRRIAARLGARLKAARFEKGRQDDKAAIESVIDGFRKAAQAQ